MSVYLGGYGGVADVLRAAQVWALLGRSLVHTAMIDEALRDGENGVTGAVVADTLSGEKPLRGRLRDYPCHSL